MDLRNLLKFAAATCFGLTVPGFGFAAQETMTIDRLIEIVTKNDLRTVEDTLDQVSKEMPFDDYAMMYRSRSLQSATPKAPRIIAFTSSAKFLMTFNGGEDGARGAQSIEAIQFRDDTKSFEFREIEFSIDKNEKPTITEANPGKCTACHQSPSRTNVDMRPNWEPYHFWPGAYASNDGFGHFSGNTDNVYGIEPQDASVMAEVPLEEARFNDFFSKVASSHSRYRFLKKIDLNNSPDGSGNQNASLADRLALLNFQRVYRLMTNENEITSVFKPAIDLAFDSYGTDPLRKSGMMDWNYTQSLPNYADYNGHQDSATDLLAPIFESLGVDTSDWSMDFRTGGRFSFGDRFETPVDAFSEMGEYWTKVAGIDNSDKALAAMQEKLPPFFKSGENLKLASRRQNMNPPDVPALMARCAKCHTNSSQGSDIPQFAFDNLDVFKTQLRLTGYARGTLLEEMAYRIGDQSTLDDQMPPNQVLLPVESASLTKFLRGLAADL